MSFIPVHLTMAVEPAGPLPQLLMYRFPSEVAPMVGSKVDIPIP